MLLQNKRDLKGTWRIINQLSGKSKKKTKSAIFVIDESLSLTTLTPIFQM